MIVIIIFFYNTWTGTFIHASTGIAIVWLYWLIEDSFHLKIELTKRK